MIMSSSKRPHTKSRLGCDQCKRRHIKCDNIAPECANCSKKGIPCGYRAWESVIDKLQLSREGTSTAAGHLPHILPTLPSPPPMSTTFSLYDLGLLHDFTLRSYTTVARRDIHVFRDIWQTDVPQLGLHHPYLMHAILSFAAAHRMHHPSPELPPDDRVQQAARDHYDQALIGMRATVSGITTELADPVLCFSILVCFVTLFLATVDGLEPIDIALDLFRTIRSTMGILSHDIVRQHLKESKIGTLIRHDDAAAARNDLPEGLCDSLDWILTCVLDQNGSSTSNKYNQTLETAAIKLKYMFTLTTSSPDSWDYLLSWPISLVPELEEFMSGIEQHEPGALCILTHWCIPLCNAPPKWFVGDWPSVLLKTVQNELAGTLWERGLQWTRSVVKSRRY